MTQTIASQLAHANTPGLKAAVTKRMNAAAAKAEKEGKNPTMVLAGFKAAATRLRKRHKSA